MQCLLMMMLLSSTLSTDDKIKSEEAVAKLLCPEKSMILRPFASDSNVTTNHLTSETSCGLVEENGCEWPQKGDFNEQMSFIIVSEEMSSVPVEEIEYVILKADTVSSPVTDSLVVYPIEDFIRIEGK